MSDLRESSFQAILDAIEASRLPGSQKAPLKEALQALYAARPNAMDKIRQPLGRALRNPAFPGIWASCVSDIPTSEVYVPLRDAAAGIEAFVEAARARS